MDDIQWRPIGSVEFHHNASGFNKILFVFTSLVDTKIGFVKYMDRFYYGSPYINTDFTGKSIEELKKIHVYEDIDIVKSCFIESVQDSAYNIFEEIKSDSIKYDNLLSLSPLTMMPTLINTYSSIGNDIKCSVICADKTEKAFAKNLVSTDTSIFIDKIEDVNPKDYARFVLDDIDIALKFNDPTTKSFLILNYRENFFYNERNKMLLLKPNVIIRIGDTNNCQICNAYRDMNIKEEY